MEGPAHRLEAVCKVLCSERFSGGMKIDQVRSFVRKGARIESAEGVILNGATARPEAENLFEGE